MSAWPGDALLNARFAAAIAQALASAGVRDVVVSPGSRHTPLVLALLERAEVRCRLVLDERVAGFVALGLSRAARAPAALLCTSGSAGAHYLPAVIEARASAVPLVVLTANRPPELHGCGAPQTIDQERLLEGQTVHARRLGPADGRDLTPAALAVAQAVAAARAPLPGPVHLDVAFREPLWSEAPSGQDPRQVPASPAAPRLLPPAAPAPTAAALDAVVDLARAGRGVLVCGPEAGGRPGAAAPFGRAVLALGRRLGWPVLADPASGAAEGAPAVASYEPLLRHPAFAAAHAPEAVIRFGRTPPSRALTEWLAASGARSLLVDPWGRWFDFTHRSEALLTADPALLCRAALERLGAGPPAEPEWAAAWTEADRRAQQALERACAVGRWGGAVARALLRALPPGTLLRVGNSLAVRDVEAFAPPGPRAVSVAVSRGANGIDGTLATAFGEALAWPGPVCVLLGDLAFLHDLGALAAARDLGVSATVVVVDNRGGGIFDHLSIARHPTAFERWFVAAPSASIAALCAGCGVEHRRVTSVSDLARAVAAPPAEGVRVLEVPVERADDVARHQAAWRAGAAAASPREALA